ncbi:hypothetical protein PRK78_001953 [Emydomyces testavorans]|uniref:Lysine-specific metallo-endopeptidase domain-containing protein n=1 Tax=Emydomyces testavorans TaxID=2070801 RepID=A0AAF0DDY4_9EURO|nr:hypothetical protein PRK78_001953 [Emydomyces testavorans]
MGRYPGPLHAFKPSFTHLLAPSISRPALERYLQRFTMHLYSSTLITLLSCSIIVVGTSLDNCFNVKKGKDKGGCDMYREGKKKADLDGYFEEAIKLITTASAGIDEYNSDQQIQKITKSFFGINPKDDHTGPKDEENQKLLKHVQVYDDAGNEWVAFWSPEVKEYYFGPPYEWEPPTYCGNRGFIAVVTPMSTGKKQLSLTLCPTGFFKSASHERIDDSKTRIGYELQKLQPKSLTLVHELVHLVKTPEETKDLMAWGPKRELKATNPKWPGNTDDFIEKGREAYTATDALFTALKTNPRLRTENNPENYAWAALAIYLARNGAKKDYSTGLLRNIPQFLGGPSSGDKRPHESDSDKRGIPDENGFRIFFS